MRKKLLCMWLAYGILFSGQAFGEAVGFNISTDDVSKLSGEVADGCRYWTDNGNASGADLVLDGTGGMVTVDWNSTNTYQYGAQGTSEEQIYYSYLDDGNPVVVTFSGLGAWLDSRNAEGYSIRVYQNTDWNDATFPAIDITSGTDSLETIQTANIVRSNTARGYVDSSTLSADNVTLTLRARDLGARQRSPFAAAKITLVDKFIPVNLSPAVGVEVPVTQQLSWEQAPEATGLGSVYNLYFGSDPNQGSLNYYALNPVKTTTTDPSDFNYNPGSLANSTTYYWRLDAIDPNNGNPTVHRGTEQWFVTQPASARIEVEPVSMTVPVGTASVQFSVEAINTDSYQWFKNGIALADDQSDTLYIGEDTATLTIYDVQVADEGSYYCQADNSLVEPDTSATVELLTQRLIGWWKLDGDLNDSVNDVYADATAHNGASVNPQFAATGIDGSAIKFNGTTDALVEIENSVDAFNFYPRGYTVSAWVNIPDMNGSWMSYVSKEGITEDNGRRGFILLASDTGDAVSTLRQSFNDLFSGTNVNGGNWHQVVGVYDATIQEGRIYVDGNLRNQVINTGMLSASPGVLIFGAQLADGSSAMTGMLDDVRIWSYPVDPVAIASMYVDFNPGSEICTEFPELDIAGPDGTGPEFRDCRVNVYDFAYLATQWLDCNIVPTCLP